MKPLVKAANCQTAEGSRPRLSRRSSPLLTTEKHPPEEAATAPPPKGQGSEEVLLLAFKIKTIRHTADPASCFLKP